MIMDFFVTPLQVPRFVFCMFIRKFAYNSCTYFRNEGASEAASSRRSGDSAKGQIRSGADDIWIRLAGWNGSQTWDGGQNDSPTWAYFSFS